MMPFKSINGKIKGIDRELWVLPREDKNTIDWPFTYGPVDFEDAFSLFSPFINKTRCCIQAGGCIGIWPLLLSRVYDNVVTFEPEPINYECLIHNIDGVKNIEPRNEALGEKRKLIHMTLDDKYIGHCGAFRIEDYGSIQMICIDDLQRDDVDLIYLDVEGYETNALIGAKKTIEHCRPLIGFEYRNFHERYKTEDPAEYIKHNFNYQIIGTVRSSDILLAPNEITAS